jgi:hypothetical protein
MQHLSTIYFGLPFLPLQIKQLECLRTIKMKTGNELMMQYNFEALEI